MENRRGFEMSFNTIFTILVGAIILFLAVFTAFRLAELFTNVEGTASARSIEILLNPVQTTIEEGKFSTISLPSETRLYNSCLRNDGFFGSQELAAERRMPNGNCPSSPTTPVRTKNKYVFSSPSLTADENIFLFTVPLEYPFKVSDLIYVWSDNQFFCFIDVPPSFQSLYDSLYRLQPKNIEFENILTPDDCAAGSTKVCFYDDSECDIIVFPGKNPLVRHSSRDIEVPRDDNDALLFAAIFGNPEDFDCQTQRLAARASQIAALYKEKSEYLSVSPAPQYCYTAMIKSELTDYESAAQQISAGNQPITSLENPKEALENKHGSFTSCPTCRLF